MGLSLFEWIGFAAAATAAFLFAAYHYRRREERRPLSGLLAALRGGALAAALFLLFDPSLPAEGRVSGGGWAVLLDGSRSLTRPARQGAGEEDATLWAAARDSAARGRGSIWIFGDASPRRVDPDSLPSEPPHGTSRLAPAIRAAAQAGYRSVRVITDGELGDADEALEWIARYDLELDWVPVTTAYPRAAIAEVRAPAWAEVGDTVEVRVFLAASGADAATATVTATDERGATVARTEVSVPEAGRRAEARLRITAGPPAGLQRFEVALADPLGDAERRDDRRVFYLDVSGPPASPVVLALQPSWEATFLLPSLGRAGDAPAAGYVRLRADRWVTMDQGFRAVSPQEIRRRSAAAPLLVLVDYGPDAPSWVHQWVRDAPRVWIFPAGGAFDVPGWEIRVGRLEDGEWYADATVPPSPIAGVLAGIEVELFPPLTGLRTVDGPGAWAPLRVRRGRRGEPRPAVVGGTSGGRRWAIAPGVAYWRWGFRPGGPRDLYRGLMTGTAGWLLEARTPRATLEPIARVVPDGEPLRFATASGADRVRLVVADSAGTPVFTYEAPPAGDKIAAPTLPPGRYQYDAEAWSDGRRVATGSGPVEVERFHPELVPGVAARPDTVASLTTDSHSAGDASAVEPARIPLRRLGWPVLLVLALLCAEWILRQRLGLR